MFALPAATQARSAVPMHNSLLRLLCDEGDIRDAKAMQCMPSVFHSGIQAEPVGPGEASRRQSRRRQSPKRRVVPSDLVKHDLKKAEGGRCAALGKYSDLRGSAIDENVFSSSEGGPFRMWL